jgi:hypothetical protein
MARRDNRTRRPTVVVRTGETTVGKQAETTCQQLSMVAANRELEKFEISFKIEERKNILPQAYT